MLFTKTIPAVCLIFLGSAAFSQSNTEVSIETDRKQIQLQFTKELKKEEPLQLNFNEPLLIPTTVLICDDFGREKVRFLLSNECQSFSLDIGPLIKGEYQMIIQRELKEICRQRFKMLD
jgi:hypothetical protein